MDSMADVLLAYKMNGAELTPDHGYPIRLIVPGYIGGRMVRQKKKAPIVGREAFHSISDIELQIGELMGKVSKMTMRSIGQIGRWAESPGQGTNVDQGKL